MKKTKPPKPAGETPKTGQPKKKKRGSTAFTVILVAILVIGVGIMAYPTVSDWWNSYHQTRAIADYVSSINDADDELIEQMLEEARDYNKRMLRKENRYRMTQEDMIEYNSLLNISGTGIMGYIQIEAIGVNLPIYHTTEESVLQVAVGHLEWSSLPVGGESTHALLSGHRGLPSARLFTDLDKLREGDIFTVTILRETLTYQIDQIRIVEPSEVSELGVVSGQDYCTLITCTPYGINTHRMLVRGTRIDNIKDAVIVTPEATRIPNYVTILAVSVPLLFLFLLFGLVFSGKRKVSEEELRRMAKNS